MATTQNTQTRTTAPVVKYICLFTPDLKRKHKRWQDGRLEFHTFNRRVMVYDEGGNVIGDAHRTKSHDVEEGDEFHLDRGNVIVQVAERVGQRVQDITDIFARKPKPQDGNPTSTPAGITTPRARPSIPNSQMRHLPLQSLLSTPGHQIGRAVIPSTSPFERRNQTPNAADHPSKRRKVDAVRTHNSSPATVVLDPTPGPPCQAATPVPRDPPRRKAFLPPRVRNFEHALNAAPKDTAAAGTSVRKSNTSGPESVDLTSTTSLPEKRVTSEGNAPATEPCQPADSPTHRAKDTTKYKAPASRRDPIRGKENRAALPKKGNADAPSGGKQLAPKNLPPRAAQTDEPPDARPPDEPTTALRLGSAQKRGLLVAKGPPARRQKRDEAPARTANGRIQAGTEGASVSTTAPEAVLGQRVETPRQPANGRTDAGSRGPAGGQPAPALALDKRDEAPAQLANKGIHARAGGAAGAKPAPETAPLANTGQRESASSLPTNVQESAGGQPAAAVAKPRTETPARGGPWSREAGDLLDYKRSTAVEPAK